MKTIHYAILLTLLCGLSGAAALPGFTAGPYLLNVTTNSAVVAFHLEKALAAKVRVFNGTDWMEFDSPQPSTSHFVEVHGLEPDFTYDYEVICADGMTQAGLGDKSFQIRTACLPGNSFSFAVYGDPRPGDNQTTRYHQEIMNQLTREEPLFALVLGDMVDDGSRGELWRQFFDVESNLLRRTAVYPVLGDNDFAGGKGLYGDYFPSLEKGYYGFQWGGVYFFGLQAWGTRQSGQSFGADSEQYKWLESELSSAAAQSAPFRVVFLHDPVFISRGRSSEILRRVWAPLFEKYKVDVVFASWHMYERSMHEGVSYIISGGAGAELIWMDPDPMYPSQAEARQYHFCKVDVSSNMMTISAITTDRTVLDSITLMPRSQEQLDSGLMERAAKRLGAEMIIEPQPGCPQVPMTFFSTDCLYCRRLLNHDLPRWAAVNNVSLKITYFDLSQEGIYDLFLSAGMDFGRQDLDVPAIFIGRQALGGQEQIDSQLPQELQEFKEDPKSYVEQMITPFSNVHDTKSAKESAFNALTLGVVLTAGLLDGINPCAFTTVILLISYLGLVGGGRRQMVYTGSVFTAAVFITYFIIGLAFFGFIKVILKGPIFVTIVNAALLIAVAALAFFSLVDFVRCLKGNPRDMTLQLPELLKNKIRQRIRDFARHKTAVLGAAFGLGVMVTGMELACTGQVYLPIITMISEPTHRLAATGYLLSYNAAFIIPLIAVFMLTVFGVSSQRLGAFFGRRVALVKLALALLFIGMGVLIAFNMGLFQ
ncbi:MAG: metallophosphoesterase [Planctomycetaceae bacterium]|nr:metallophosphoesterase [Planctomycetaceae bacterium]